LPDLNRDPEDGWRQFGLAFVCKNFSRLAAREDYQKALNQRAIEFTRRAAERAAPELEPLALLNLCELYFEQGDLDQARKCAEGLIEKNPEPGLFVHRRARLITGLALAKSRKLPEAVAALGDYLSTFGAAKLRLQEDEFRFELSLEELIQALETFQQTGQLDKVPGLIEVGARLWPNEPRLKTLQEALKGHRR
jgi:tetratricopeptide (TPR) repeat protein